MRFAIQTHEGEIIDDFSWTLIQSLRYQNWIGGKGDHSYIEIEAGAIEQFTHLTARQYVPVGSVEFVVKWMDTYYGTRPKPRNVPDELIRLADRHIWNLVIESVEDSPPEHWDDHHVKSCDIIKPTVMPKTGTFQVSEEIDFLSEWRAFIFKGELVGLQNYSGDFTRFPPIDWIKIYPIPAFKSAPCAYTLDVGMMPMGNWTVVEVHDFFSCGLYGFADHTKLPFMFWQWWKEWENKIGGK